MSDEGLSGAQRVAAFLLSLEREEAARVLSEMDESIISDVATAMTELDSGFASADKVDGLYQDLAKFLNSRSGVRPTENDDLLQRLSSALGDERAGAVLEEIQARRVHERPFAEVERRSPELIATALADEAPAAIALVLAHVDPAISAKVLSSFSGGRALESVKRMAELVPASFQTLRCVATALDAKLTEAEKGPVGSDRSTRLQSIAEMLTFSQQETERTVLEGLGSDDEETAEVIKEFMFTWTDLAGVDQRSMQKILASVDTRTLAVALKGSPPEVESNIMDNLSARVKEMVLDERELAGQLPLSEVMEARGETLKGVRALMDSGEFKPTRGGEELVS